MQLFAPVLGFGFGRFRLWLLFLATSTCISLGLVEPELGAPLDDLHLMVDVVRQHLGDVQRVWDAVHQRHGVDAEVLLQLGQLEQLVQHHIGHGVPLQLDDQPGSQGMRRPPCIRPWLAM